MFYDMPSIYKNAFQFLSSTGQLGDGKSENNQPTETAKNIKDFGMIEVVNSKDPANYIQTINIIGQIEGHGVSSPQTKSTKYEHVIPELIAMEQNPNVKGVLITLNTLGGDVEAGLAIAEMINSLSMPTVSLVLGGSHSIGVPLATASDYAFITPSATMILHPIRMNGLIIGVPQTFDYFKKMQERITDFIVRTSSVKKEVLEGLLQETGDLLNDMGTILIGQEAVDYGLIEEVGGITDALTKLNSMIKEKEKEKEKENKE
ncbi:ClpP family protease [Candidatus Arthromitus sp. SFB-turkey]|uniref:ClpP family protease n=1 Tax=Candidatus Arthromitus sp. SFB-turkey TaxID=1840217 RepID=UPI0009EDA431|nr:ATP-dependent Clp protease proteolytic subunit [Candidatus Arthromitus sp. SFB-turkey]HJD00714.1 ATP-dependent Clp protease proteolytic subunit [Candidatus Dwaynia gallinarum]